MRKTVFPLVLPLFVALLSPLSAKGQTSPAARIKQPVTEDQLKTLSGNTHPLARARFDQGVAPVDLPMEHMLLILTSSSAQQAALKNLLDQQQDKSSPQYHRWLTPQQFGEQFGAADEDIATISAWLKSHGFTINRVSNGKTVIDFSGTAAQVAQAFHTEIHKYVVKGIQHWANASDPKIPAALSPVIGGIATLHNFTKKPQLVALNRSFQAVYQPGARPQFTASDGSHALSPADYAVIYDINPLYQAGTNGNGAIIAVVGRTDIKVSDVTDFRNIFGLSNNPPQIIHNGTDPGDLGDGEEAEAVLDTSWAGATAPGATVKLVVSATTNTTDGVDLSELYIIDNNFGDVMTESFGDCEANYGQSDADYYSSLAQQAAAEGITYLVAAGDSGAEGCDDPNQSSANGPLSVNILAATPYTIAVGGSEFNEGSHGSTYWSSSNNSVEASALGYIPEVVWNESCTASGATACTGDNTPGLWAGGGGASMFFSKPSWQSGIVGIPSDGARDLPDVSLTAAGHDAYLLCLDGSCVPNSDGLIDFQGYGGTSAATPSFAGIMALVVQEYGRQGEANYVLYPKAAAETLSSCNASISPASNCVFNDITIGNNAVPGETGYGTSSGDYQATVGYDLATGLGSVNAANLVNYWNGAPSTSSNFQIVVTYPSSLQSTFVGASQFSGTATRTGASITGVAISIDNVPYGQATVSGNNWSISVNTDQLADGVHKLDVAAASSLGDYGTVSSSFTVANWSASNPMTVDIDVPATNSSAFSGVVGFGGWVLDDTGAISAVQISIDGVLYGNAVYGTYRPDVCAVFPGRSGCPNIGWIFSLDTATLADGQHILAVSGYTAAGDNSTITQIFKTSNLAGSGLLIDIDRPGPTSGTFSGPAGFGGWALDNNSGVSISSVSISVDGVIIGNAIYGDVRPDVCKVYPGRTGCPNVGWNVLIDTSSLSNGAHVLQVEATASNGQQATASASFIVANSRTASPIKMNIDVPRSVDSYLTGLTTVSGWALDPNGSITSVSISIDGDPKGNATYGLNRPDVCAVFPISSSCPNVGWALTLDSSLIPNGPHTFAATATSSNGDVLTFSTPVTIANWTTGNPMKISIDNPNSNSPALSGIVAIGGWALSDIAGIANITISVDGVLYGNATYGGSRPDVCTVFPGRIGCPNVGWNFPLNTYLLANGPHTLEVTATSSGGQSSTVSIPFTVSNSCPVLINIDVPAFGSILTGKATISGWAIDTTTGITISTVQILVDGVPLYDAVYGAYQRPDVCTAFPGTAGCPSVGWTSTIDTTLLASGIHTLDVTATATNGQQATNSTSFLVEQ